MAQKYLHQLSNLLLQSADLFFPNLCLHCDTKIEPGKRYLCSDCYGNLPVIKSVTCSYCGIHLPELDERIKLKVCPFCAGEDFLFDNCRSVFAYDDIIQVLIHNLKYFEMTGIAKYLAAPMISWLVEYEPFPEVDLVIPVPLHKVRKRERGFNQSELLAKCIASHFNWNYEPNLLKRVRYTKSQTQLKDFERKVNVKQAFSVDKITVLKDANVLIIDDVFTTGATVNAIAEQLKSCMTAKVFVLTVARAGITVQDIKNL